MKIKKIEELKKEKGKIKGLKIFHFTLITIFKILLLILLIRAIKTGDKDRILLVFLSSLTVYYREYIRVITKMEISVYMQIITTIFIILTVLLGTLFNVYDKITWWDTLLHFSSGILLTFFGLMVITLFKEKNKNIKLTLGLLMFFAFTFAMTAGVIWEILEFGADTIFGFDAQRAKGVEYGVLDTMIDILANTSGAIITGCIIYFAFRKKKEKEIDNKLREWFVVEK